MCRGSIHFHISTFPAPARFISRAMFRSPERPRTMRERVQQRRRFLSLARENGMC